MRCPICDRDFDPVAPTAAKPFCSERCRLVDLGRWLGESYTFQVEPGAEDDDAAESAESERETG